MRKVMLGLVAALVVLLVGCSHGEIHEAYRIPTARSTVTGAGHTESVTEVYPQQNPMVLWTPDGGRTWYLIAPTQTVPVLGGAQ